MSKIGDFELACPDNFRLSETALELSYRIRVYDSVLNDEAVALKFSKTAQPYEATVQLWSDPLGDSADVKWQTLKDKEGTVLTVQQGADAAPTTVSVTNSLVRRVNRPVRNYTTSGVINVFTIEFTKLKDD